jgi:hypothetical protein
MAVAITDPRKLGITTTLPAAECGGFPSLGESTTLGIASRRAILGALADAPIHIPFVTSGSGRSGSCGTSGGFGSTRSLIDVGEPGRAASGGGVKHLDGFVTWVATAVENRPSERHVTAFLGI